MTAPLTPPPQPNHQPPHHVWQAPPPGYAPGHEEDGPGMKTELREAAVITVATAIGGVLLGLLWCWLAPRVPLVSDGAAVYPKDVEGEQVIGVDGTFSLLAVGFGLVTAVVVFLLRRRGGIPLIVALTVGGILASLLAWRLGIWLGPTQDVIAHAKEAGKGVTFDAPLELNAKGALLAWSVSALLVHLGLTALFAPRDPDPYGQPQFPQSGP
ncbi:MULTISPECIES: AAA family ATPase [Streptomyces]|uniref:AAA family ATPase n=1 Tax=Streptomyces liliifuscus TaxID=2797636 RepID=A0A7T7RES0_9ACTN|nr:AAA family ATPase [Streptomyces liliifuscus]QQM43950.1 AAA family ATPase [Streptomyces liliifuscus]